MSKENTLPIVQPENVAHEVLDALGALLHSAEITSKTFTRPIGGGEGEMAEIVIGEPSKGDNSHVVLSTYGLGGSDTNGTLTAVAEGEERELNFHAEIFMVADSSATANLFAEELARLAYFVVDTKTALVPGNIIGFQQDDEEFIYVFSERSLGALADHAQAPILSEGFAVCFVAATRIYPEEAVLLKEEKITPDQLNEFLISLGRDAYKAKRDVFVLKGDDESK